MIYCVQIAVDVLQVQMSVNMLWYMHLNCVCIYMCQDLVQHVMCHTWWWRYRHVHQHCTAALFFVHFFHLSCFTMPLWMSIYRLFHTRSVHKEIFFHVQSRVSLPMWCVDYSVFNIRIARCIPQTSKKVPYTCHACVATMTWFLSIESIARRLGADIWLRLPKQAFLSDLYNARQI